MDVAIETDISKGDNTNSVEDNLTTINDSEVKVKNDEDVKEETETAEQEENDGTETKTDTADLYGYTRRDEFTSEIFKIEITNLPRVGFKVNDFWGISVVFGGDIVDYDC